MSQALPVILRHLRNDLATVVNCINEYERLTVRAEWGITPRDAQDRALKAIETRLQSACDRIGILPSERWALQDQILHLQQECERLTAANVMALQERAA